MDELLLYYYRFLFIFMNFDYNCLVFPLQWMIVRGLPITNLSSLPHILLHYRYF